MYKQNLHVHSIYCDGKNTHEEVQEQAIRLGFYSIGFSGHSYMSYSPSGGMSFENEVKYREDITRLKDTYKDNHSREKGKIL